MIVFIDDQAPVWFFLLEAVYGGNIPTNDLKIFRNYSAFIKDFEAKSQEYEAIKALVLDIRAPEQNGQLRFKDGSVIDLMPSFEGLGFLGGIGQKPSLSLLEEVPKVILTQLSIDKQMRHDCMLYGIKENHIFDKYNREDLIELRDFLKQALR